MRMKNKDIHLRLTEDEYAMLSDSANKCGMSKSEYLCCMIQQIVPKETPPIEYHEVIRELHAIGNNLNQIAKTANTTNIIDKQEYDENAQRLKNVLLHIIHAVTFPEKR